MQLQLTAQRAAKNPASNVASLVSPLQEYAKTDAAASPGAPGAIPVRHHSLRSKDTDS
jgi:hypothetical protein